LDLVAEIEGVFRSLVETVIKVVLHVLVVIFT